MLRALLTLSVTVMSFAFALPLAAQEKVDRVAEEGKWGVYLRASPKLCYIASEPEKTVNRKGGRTVSVRRGEILLYVVQNGGELQVSFTGGYTFKSETPLVLNIDGSKYNLFSQGEFAWAQVGDDPKIINSMKAGANARLVALSSRGTETTDDFSLIGFTAALEKLAAACK